MQVGAWHNYVVLPSKIAVMKEKEHLQQGTSDSGNKDRNEKQLITSDSIKNAHAAGDGAMERSLDSIPDEEELKKEADQHPRRPEQY
ncbi:MAG TPA: hypothetical protein VNU93_08725 [Verrucomicrobiae bacterium]|nr:hypothetical protein [Verrucomicrobiae bacterium]